MAEEGRREETAARRQEEMAGVKPATFDAPGRADGDWLGPLGPLLLVFLVIMVLLLLTYVLFAAHGGG